VTKPRIDLLSVLLSTIGFGGVVFGFSKAGEGSEGWSSMVVIISIAIGLVALLFFILRQNMSNPMLNLRVFKYPMYVIGMLLIMSCMLISMSSTIILPMFLQTGKELSVLITGLMLLPGSVLSGLIQP